MSEEKSESKDLVVKTFTNDSIANYKSYGDKSLVENLQNAEVAINKVQYTERIWDRSRSQFMLKHLTCSQADNWTRLRQVSAEMARKRMALNEAKFGYMEAVAKAKIMSFFPLALADNPSSLALSDTFLSQQTPP